MGSAVSSSSSAASFNVWGNRSSGDVKRYYEIGSVIGRGGFATVFNAIVIRKRPFIGANGNVAIKTIMGNMDNSVQFQRTQDEIKIMRALKSPRCIKYYEHFVEGNATYIVMELVNGSNLLHHVVTERTLTEVQSATIVRQIAEALDHLRTKKIIHRDIKLENVLVTVDGQGNTSIKLADYGLAVLQSSDDEIFYDICGTPIYSSPEMLQQSYSFEVDMWALGVVLYILLCGYPPFFEDEKGYKKMIQCILKGEYFFHRKNWENISDEPKCLISKLLSVNPKERPTPTEVMSNVWVTEFSTVVESGEPREVHSYCAPNGKLPVLSDFAVSQYAESWYTSYYDNSLGGSQGSIVGTSKAEPLTARIVEEAITSPA